MSLINKDQAPRQRMLDDHDMHWQEEDSRSLYVKVICSLILTAIMVFLLTIYSQVEASTVWQSVSDSSLVDMWGEE
jgi:hypothetical protein